MGCQRSLNDKSGIGFIGNSDKQIRHAPKNTKLCSYCCTKGHSANKYQKKRLVGIKYIWIPKSLIANSKGPKPLGYLSMSLDLLTQVLQTKSKRRNKWYMDSSTSGHLEGEEEVFI